ncbi:uncharacterized protein LOC109850306 [Asparagus officinalis]|uniref:uncharacterized protein LOC109850306 n=1 Tax=Asparagus officinalis TaxID=4686 RepID=UPI00098E65B1|nr:uncharacterized protein LOC109850306 [Asparagus officinalis]
MLSSQMSRCLSLRWPSSTSRRGYRALAMDGYSSEEDSTVKIIVGKEKRVFFVDPFVLRKNPFRVLLEMVKNKESLERDSIFVDVDAILFEHLLWLVYNDCSASTASLLELNLREIIEFYSQDY